ncbi:MAG: addiction module protein [Bryobacteraceae bacterium]|jgi:hypothetical protein
MNSVSIFDLSPSEKLQLVEDLWDDLAGTGGRAGPSLAEIGKSRNWRAGRQIR